MVRKLSIILLILLAGFFISTKLGTQEVIQIKETPAAATSSATISSPTPSPKPIPQIPIHSGRQVRVPILLYHYIGNNPNPEDKARDNLSVSPDKFDEQMGYLKDNGYNPIILDTLAAALSGQITLPDKSIIITFDDGYIDLFYNAFPILQKYGMKAVAFIPTGLVGTSYYSSWDQLDTMQKSGLISMQSHSVNHANLPSLTTAKLAFELGESKKVLEARYGQPVNFIAYPYGTSNQSVRNSVKGLGYIGGLGTWYSTIQSEGVIFNMPRVKVGGGMSLETFISRL